MAHQVIKIQNVKCPKPVYIANVGDFPQFEETLQALCQKFISPDWEWTFKVGGKVQREIEKKDPDNEGIQMIYKQTTTTHFDPNDGYNVKYKTPMKQEHTGGEDKSSSSQQGFSSLQDGFSFPQPPPKPLHPPSVVSKGVAEAMGKRNWEVEKLKEVEDLFFKIN